MIIFYNPIIIFYNLADYYIQNSINIIDAVSNFATDGIIRDVVFIS